MPFYEPIYLNLYCPMFTPQKQLFSRLLARFRRRDSVVDALEQFSSRSVIRTLLRAAGQNACPVSFYAEFSGQPPENVLESVGNILGLPTNTTLDIPTRELIASTGMSAESMQNASVLPCRSIASIAGYCLVVSCPTQLDVAAFQRQGVKTFLGLRAQIDALWACYREQISQLPQAKILDVVQRLAADARKLGATEAFLGYPSEEHYEFYVGAQRYQGKADPLVYRSVSLYLKRWRSLFLEIADEDHRPLFLGLSDGPGFPVCCLSWDHDGEMLLPLASAPRTLGAPSHAAHRETPPVVQTTAFPSLLLWLIDDDDKFSGLLRVVLASKGYEVRRMRDGLEALSALRGTQDPPSLIVCDVHMPVMDGSTFLDQVAELEMEIPVLMLTSDEDHLLEAELALRGARAFVRKSQDPQVLLAWIRNLLGQNKIIPFHGRVASESCSPPSLV